MRCCNPGLYLFTLICSSTGNAGDLEPIQAILGATKISDEQGKELKNCKNLLENKVYEKRISGILKK